MSVESGPDAVDGVPAGLSCSLCGHPLAAEAVFVQCYPDGDRSVPAAAADDGLLTVCDGCGTEVDDLLDAWTSHDRPPVGDSYSIGTGYRRIAEDCSFCNRPLDADGLLGVEYFHREDATETTCQSENYSLCSDCSRIFAEFLDGVGDAT